MDLFRINNNMTDPKDFMRSAGLWGGKQEAVKEDILGDFPHYIIIGAQKSGTSSLYDYLIDHPMVVPAHRKEVHFFDWVVGYEKQSKKSFIEKHLREPTEAELADILLREYEAWFQIDRLKCSGCQGKITGEATPVYMFKFWQAIPYMRSILKHQPKLIVILRDPVARAYSHFEMAWYAPTNTVNSDNINDAFARAVRIELSRITRLGIEPGSSPEQYASLYKKYSSLSNPFVKNFVGRGLYIFQLEAWSQHFDDIYVLETEDFIQSGVHKTMQGVHDFLGLQNSAVRHPKVDKKGHYIEPLRSDTKALLCEFYAPYNKKLEEFLGHPLQFHACNNETHSSLLPEHNINKTNMMI